MQPLTISREAVRLRPLRLTDADAVYRACQDPQVQRWTVAVPVPYTRSDADAFVNVIAPQGWADETTLTWAIDHPGHEDLLGVISLERLGPGADMVGYWLGPQARGKGVATNAVWEACRFGFEAGREAIQWQALDGNEASRRVAERTGFRVSGPVRRLINQRGSWKDGWVGTLLPSDSRMPAPAVLSDGTVTLRSWRGSDLDALPGLVDDAVLIWTGVPGRTAAELTGWLEMNRRPLWPPEARFAIVDDRQQLLGYVRVSRDGAPGELSLGWWLGPGGRGRGHAQRALRLALAWAAEFGPGRFSAGIFAGNDASITLAERVGMRCEGLRRGYWSAASAGGPRRDGWLYSLVPTDAGWPAAS